MHGNETEEERRGERERTRRRTLTGFIGAAAFLPEAWTSPVVQSVVLPAHAQTSPGADDENGDVEEVESLVFDACSVGTDITLGPVGPPFANIDVTVSGSVSGPGSVEGITVDVEAFLSNDGTATEFPQTQSMSVLTDVNGDYTATFAGVSAFLIFQLTLCDDTFPDGITAVASSDDPRVAGTTECTGSFTCAELQAVLP